MTLRTRSLIIRSVVVFFGLALLHAILSVAWIREDPKASSQLGDAVIRIERFFDSPKKFDCVLVGTSLSAHLKFKSPKIGSKWHADVYNLAIAGGSALTGLGLIEARQAPVDCIVVEVNYIDRGADQQLIDRTSWAPAALVRKWFPGARHENQPLNQLLTFLKQLRAVKETASRDVSMAGSVEHARTKVESERIAQQLKLHQHPNQEAIRKGSSAFALAAERSMRLGTKLFILEMPVETEMLATPDYQARYRKLDEVIQALKSTYPDQITSLPLEPTGWHTTDGIHLRPASLARVAGLIQSYVTHELRTRGRPMPD